MKLAKSSKLSSSDDEEGQTSYITALVLVVPGVILYAYILYIMLSKLVYPASFLPFTHQHSTLNDSSVEEHGQGEALHYKHLNSLRVVLTTHLEA